MYHCYFDLNRVKKSEQNQKQEYAMALLHSWIDEDYHIITKEEFKSNPNLRRQEEKNQIKRCKQDYRDNIEYNMKHLTHDQFTFGWINEYKFERVLGVGKHGVTLLMRSKIVPKELLAYKFVSFRSASARKSPLLTRIEHEFWMSKQFNNMGIGLTSLYMHVYPNLQMAMMIQKVGRVTLRDFLLCIMTQYEPHENKREYKACMGQIMKQLIHLLNVMNRHQVTHGDFHIFNILVEDFDDNKIENPILKLIDFDLSSTRFYFPFLDIYQLMRTLILDKNDLTQPKLIACYDAFIHDIEGVLIDWLGKHYTPSTYEIPVIQEVIKTKRWQSTAYLKQLHELYRSKTHLQERKEKETSHSTTTSESSGSKSKYAHTVPSSHSKSKSKSVSISKAKTPEIDIEN